MSGNLTKKQLAVAAIAGTILFGAGISGCSRTQTAEELLVEAQQYEQKGDRKAALIQLKNAVEKNPENAQVRLRLGTLQLEMGDAPSAEKELRRAASLNLPAATIAPLLAQSLLAQGKFEPLLNDISADQAKGSAILLARRGDAFLALNKRDEARASYQAGLAVDANSGDALGGLARIALLGNDTATAEGILDDAAVRAPKNTDIWMMKAAILRSQAKSQEALAAYDKVLTIDPTHRSANLEKVFVHVGLKDTAAAKVDLEAARKNGANSLNLTYAQALLQFNGGEYPAAKESLQKILKVAPDHPPSMLLAGAVELNLNNLRQSEQHLRRYLEGNSDNLYARKLLAQGLLKQKESAAAVAALEPALKTGSDDGQLLALAGQAYLQTRDYAKATPYLEKASALAPEAAGVRTALGMSRLGQGNAAGGIGELEQAARLDPSSIEAGAALVQAQLGIGKTERALAAMAALEKAQPGSAVVQNIKGDVALRSNDRKLARASFEKAIALDAAYFPAITNLAQMDVAEKNFSGAKKRFEAVLARDDKNVDAMNAMAALGKLQNDPAETGKWLEMAQTKNPDALRPALNLGGHYLSSKQPEKAVALLRKTLVTHPTDVQVIDLLGQAQLATKDFPGALESFSKLAAADPKSPMPQMRLAAVRMQMKNEPAAAEALKRALTISPNFLPALAGQMEMALRAGKPDDALAIARRVQADSPKAPNGYVLEGDMMLATKNVPGALAAYDKAFAITNSPALLVKISQVLAQNGRAPDGAARLEKFHAAYPGNDMIAMLVADNHLAKRQFKPAIASLEAALKVRKEDPAALNNLAWAYQQEKDPRALPTAEQAYKLAGQNAAIMDTLGWILVERGDTARGIDLLRKAVATAPEASDMRYHLAAALAKSGDKAGARKEAEQLVASGKPFPALEDTKALLKQL
ncbi:XrtA/PEP-CTERM system TPR-repeat protein PrsT [Massilia aurea]|uniref:XrtA/PEP-CTERM system TPR-repeat protein PrsT n=1 Tax=Massilia aurea TaxID=373040 RepID=UPI003462CABB